MIEQSGLFIKELKKRMSNQNKLRNLENKKIELVRKLQLCEHYKEKITKFVQELNNQYNNGLINYKEYYYKLNRALDQRTPEQWIKEYDSSIWYYKHSLNSCEREIKKQENKAKIAPVVMIAVIFMILGFGFLFLKPAITGLIVGIERDAYTQEINLVVNESSVDEWQPEHAGILRSARVSGKILGNGSVRIYLDDKLVLDSSKLEKSGISMITGLAVSDLTETNESTVFNETNENITNITEETENITAQEIESITNITVPEENITVLEEIETNITIPEEIDVSENITMPEEDVPELPEENITAPISELVEVNITEIIFTDVCIETCSLDLNKISYDLRFEIEDAVLYLDSISYTIRPIKIPEEVPKAVENISKLEETIQGQAEINKPVKWTKKITLDETSSDLTVKLPKNISNIKVSKIKDKIKEEISLDKLKIREDEQLKPIKEYVAKKTEDPEEETELIIEEDVKEIEIEYYTKAPEVTEKEINAHKKQIVVSSDVHYTNITAYTTITEAPKDSIKLYRTTGGIRELTQIVNYTDTNNNSLIDYIGWIVPSLSNETYEVEITILNVQSYPTVGGNWTVKFNTTGTANLTIRAVNGTTWSNTNEDNDLKLLEIKCGNEILNYYWINNSVLISNYSCDNETGFETSKVLTPGKHHLEFDFGGIKALAHNWAGNSPTIKWELPTPPDGNITENNWVYLNTTIIDDNETSAFFDWNYSLLAYWNFEHISTVDGTVYDNSTYGYDGTLYNHATNTTVTGKFGDALAFDGVDDYIKIEDVMVTNPSELTIAAWIKKEDRGSGTYEVALHQASNSNIGTSSYFIGVESNDNLLATIGANSGAPSTWEAGRITPNTPAVYGQWYHLAAVWDGSVVRVYLDGEWNKQYDLASYTPWTTPTRIGASNDGTTYQFGGDVDEVLIVERALSAEEILALYNNTANRLYHNFTDLSPGLYNYSAYVIDEDGNLNITEERNITLEEKINPKIGLKVITPPDFNALNVTQNAFFNVSANVSCHDANCGEINVSLEAETCDIEVFDESGNFTVPAEITEVQVLVVGGGGSAGTQGDCGTATGSGGGGAGGLIYNESYSVTPGQVINITIGAGGIAPISTGIGLNGGDSIFGTINASGGGGGAHRYDTSAANGGSGGGGGYACAGGTGVAGQGYAGGTGTNDFGGSGGGGASEVGVSGSGDDGQNGGDGKDYSSIFGTDIGDGGWFAGGGGGGAKDSCIGGTGGNGGGGDGVANLNGTSAINGTGGGGGGSGDNGHKGGDGGSGIVIVKYSQIIEGPINTTIGATPFYTNAITNPLTTSSLDAEKSEIITFWINATGSATSEINYTFFVYANMVSDSSIENKSGEWDVTIVEAPVDTEYPQFSAYWDDNATLEESGTGHFNITVENTNGTVLLEINGTNVTATNLTLNVYNVSYDFITNDTYTYRWHSWGNGTLENYNVSDDRSYVVNASANQPPTITDISDISEQSVTEAGVSYVEFFVLASDENGADNLNGTSLNATFSKAGEETRFNSSCSWKNDVNTTTANYTCTIGIWYWDGAGTWNVNATILDLSSAQSASYGEIFTLQETTAMVMSPTALGWLTINLTSTNVLSNTDPIIINNTANKNITDGNVKVTAIGLKGAEITSEFIYAENFSVNTADACGGTDMVNNTATAVSGSTAYKGNNSAGEGQEELYFCLKGMLQTISAQTYSATGGDSWTIAVE